MVQQLTAYVSRPSISINNNADGWLTSQLQSALVEETTEGLCRCEVLFNYVGQSKQQATSINYLNEIASTLNFGTEFTLSVPQSNTTFGQIFRGKVSGLEAAYPQEGNPLITVLAEDQLQKLRMTRRTRTFENMLDAEVIRQIAQEHGLTPQLAGLPQEAPHKILAQVNQSDLAFIRELARNSGVELWVDGKTLFAQSRTNRATTRITLSYGQELYSFRLRADLAHQCTEVHVTGWDVNTKSAIDAQCGQNGIANELESSQRSGSSLLSSTFGKRKEYIVHTVPLTTEEAQSSATARYRERARRFVTGTGVARGDARIRVGCKVALEGLGSLFNGLYYVTQARHSYDSMYAYRTTFEVESVGLNNLPF